MLTTGKLMNVSLNLNEYEKLALSMLDVKFHLSSLHTVWLWEFQVESSTSILYPSVSNGIWQCAYV